MSDKKIVAQNRRAFHDYHILETYEAGIALQGTEVKSVRQGAVNLKESFGKIIKDELFLMNCHISPYSHGNVYNHEPLRTRKLLLHRDEINKIMGKMTRKGLAIAVISMYFKKGKAKVEIGLAKGKKDYDRREDIKKRDIQREQGRYDVKL